MNNNYKDNDISVHTSGFVFKKQKRKMLTEYLCKL